MLQETSLFLAFGWLSWLTCSRALFLQEAAEDFFRIPAVDIFPSNGVVVYAGDSVGKYCNRCHVVYSLFRAWPLHTKNQESSCMTGDIFAHNFLRDVFRPNQA